MKKHAHAVALAIPFLFFLQLAGTLIESIYILDLLRSGLDEKALGVLFFFSPLLVAPFFKRRPREAAWLSFAILAAARAALPFLGTANRLLAAGLGTGAALALIPLVAGARLRSDGARFEARFGAAALALAVSLSAALRAAGSGIEYSLAPAGGWVAPALCLGLGWALTRLDFAGAAAGAAAAEPAGNQSRGIGAALAGLILVLVLVMFSISAPSVIARWTEGSYPAIALAVVLLAAAAAGVALARPGILRRIGGGSLLAWNLAFAACLTALVLAHGVAFPPALDSPAVVVGRPGWPQRLLLALTLLSSPVLYLDAGLFLRRLRTAIAAPFRLVAGYLAGGLALILLVFANIFTNVWGYVKPISPFFRGKFWLPFLAASLLVALLAWATGRGAKEPERAEKERLHPAWALIFAAACLATALWSLPSPAPVARQDADSFRVMTFNTQQFNDKAGEKSVDRQLALIREVSPDLLALQESDSTRISLNNNDYVRYLAVKLGYHSYFGPKTVAGSYGTALLSRYPLEDSRSVYVYSDKDETGIAEAEIVVAGHRISIYNVHPDSSDPAMMVFAETLLERSRDKPYAVALGDFNLRDYEEAYKLIDGERVNAWTSVYPSEVGADGVDMSGNDRIDHIFVSKSLGVRDPRYVKPPASATDHAVHWTDLRFAEP